MTTEKEPTFRIDIRTCSFNKLSMVQLTKMLRLMHDLGLTKFYTITEDTNVLPPLLEWEKDKEKAKEFVK